MMIRGLLRELAPALPKRVSNKWPATRLAANRTERVKGRMTFLISSISTIKGIKRGGVPVGTRPEKKFWEFLIILKSMYPSHMGRARLTVIDMWPVGVKIKGAILNRFMDAMNEKILTMIKVDPGRTVKDKIDINSLLIALIN